MTMKSLGLISLFLLTANILLQCIGKIQFVLGVEQISESANNYIYIGCIVIGLTIGILWSIIFSLHAAREKFYLLVQSGIRFLLAYAISTYGFAKVFKHQFSVPEYIKDIPIGEQSGFWLTWCYFGYSYPFSVTIAIGQIVGSLLLLFNRTKLLGTFIVLPIMLNIVFINIFYDINFGAFINSLIYTLGLTFLILLNYKELVEIFFRTTDTVNTFNAKSILKITIKALMIVSALGSTLLNQYLFRDNSIVEGVYATKNITKNNVTFDSKNKSDSTLTKVYFEYEGLAIIEYNDHHRRTYNNYKIDKKAILLFFQSDHQQIDTLKADIADLANLNFMGKIGNDSIRVNLKKIR
jgi:hypothetical protein